MRRTESLLLAPGALVIVLAAQGCSTHPQEGRADWDRLGRAAAPVGRTAPPGGLPGLPEAGAAPARSAAACPLEVFDKHGDQLFLADTSVSLDAVARRATLAAGAGSLSWAIYQFPAGDEPAAGAAHLFFGQRSGQTAYIGVSDYSAGAWKWFPLPLDAQPDPLQQDAFLVDFGPAANAASPLGNIYLAVACFDGQSADLNYITFYPGSIRAIRLEGLSASPGLDPLAIQLSWDAVSDATGYELLCTDSPAGEFQPLDSVGPGVSSYDHTAASPLPAANGVLYYYRVRPLFTEGACGISGAASGWRGLPFAGEPQASYRAEPAVVRLRWVPVAGAGSYKVYGDSVLAPPIAELPGNAGAFDLLVLDGDFSDHSYLLVANDGVDDMPPQLLGTGAVLDLQIMTVDSSRHAYPELSAALPGGAPGFCWYDKDSERLCFTGASGPLPSDPAHFNTYFIDTTAPAGRYNSLGLVGGLPAVGYFNAADEACRYAFGQTAAPDAPGDWSAANASPGPDQGLEAELLELGGKPALFYVDGSALMLARPADATPQGPQDWTAFQVAPDANALSAVVRDGRPLLAFSGPAFELFFAESDSPTPTSAADFAIHQLDDALRCDRDLDLACLPGPDARPCIAFANVDATNSTSVLTVALADSTSPQGAGSWTAMNVSAVSQQYTGLTPALLMLPEGPAVFHASTSTVTGIKYLIYSKARSATPNEAGDWDSIFADSSGGSVGAGCAALLLQNGRPAAAYCWTDPTRADLNNLRYAFEVQH